MFAVLAVAGWANWRAFDASKQGLALGLACAVAAPALELLMMRWLGLWHYPRPDVCGDLGFPSWCAPWTKQGFRV